MNKPKRIMAFLLFLIGEGFGICCFASEAIVDSRIGGGFEWNSKIIEAECIEAQAITGIGCITRWDLNKQKRLGQTFRCIGPILKAVQLGVDNGIDSNYVRFYYGMSGVKITVRVKRGGVNGEIVGEKVFLPDKKGHMPATLLIDVNRKSDISVLWYFELEVEPQKFISGKNTVTIAYDNYPEGCMWRDGEKVADRDLPLVIYRSWHKEKRVADDVLFWWAPSEERIWLDAQKTVRLMMRDGACEGVKLSAARNEWETFQLIVTPKKGVRVKNVEVQIMPFIMRGSKGELFSERNMIGGKNIRIWRLRYSKEYNNKCVRDKTIEIADVEKGYGTSGILYPDPLEMTNVARVSEEYSSGQFNTTFVVSVYVPESVSAGIYDSFAKLIINDKIILTKSIVLEVFDFVLPKRTHTRTALFSKATGSFELQKRLINLFADYRIAVPAFSKDMCGVLRKGKFSEQSYKEILGEEMQREFVRLAKLLNSRGLDVCGVMPWADTYRMYRGDDKGREGIIRFWRVYYEILKRYKWDNQAYARLPDELGVNQLKNVKAIADLFRRCAPSVKIMITSTGTTNPEELGRVVGLADIWTPGLTWARKRTLAFFQSRARAGDKIWPYIHDSLYHINDVAAGRMFFWLLQKWGFDGCTYWCLGPRGKYKPAWFGVIRRDTVWSGDGELLYPGNIKSDWGREGGSELSGEYWIAFRLHRIRDGIEDREYFWMMNNLADKLKENGKLTKDIAARIDKLNMMPYKATFGMGNFIHKPEMINRIRKEIANVIVEIQERQTNERDDSSWSGLADFGSDSR